MKVRRFEFRQGASSKFWEIRPDGTGFVVRFGRVGSDGAESRRAFAGRATATREFAKIVASKLKSGYQEVASGGPASKPARRTSTAATKGGDGGPAPAAEDADPTVASLYLVSKRIAPAKPADVDRLERQLGYRTPKGYRGYITTLGPGQYCDALSIRTPDAILRDLTRDRKMLKASFDELWAEHGAPVNAKQLADAAIIGSCANGDHLATCSALAGKILVLKRNDNDNALAPAGLSDLAALLNVCYAKWKAPTPAYFFPDRPAWRDHAQLVGRAKPKDVAAVVRKSFPDGRVVAFPADKPATGGYDLFFVESLGGQVNVSYGERLELYANLDAGQHRAYRTFLDAFAQRFGLTVYKEPEEVPRPKPLVTLKVGKPPRLKPVATFDHDGPVTLLALSPDGQLLATASHNARQVVNLWHAAGGEKAAELKVEYGRAAGFSADGRFLAMGTRTGAAVADVVAGEMLKAFKPLKGVAPSMERMSFSPNGRQLAVCDRGEEGVVWDVAKGRPVVTIRGGENPPAHARFLADGTPAMVRADADRHVGVFDMRTGKSLGRVNAQHPPREAALSADGQSLALVAGDNIDVWSTRTGELRFTLQGQCPVAVAMSEDGRWVAMGQQDRAAILWDLKRKAAVGLLSDKKGNVRHVAFSADGSTVTVASWHEVFVYRLK